MTPSRLVLTLAIVAAPVATAGAVARQNAMPATTCVALTLPNVRGVDGDATSFATAVRELFANYLKGPTLRTVPLEARLTSQALLEARAGDCGQMLLVAVERKRAGGNSIGRVIGQAAGAAVVRAPIYGGVSGAVASGATWAGGEALYRFASDIRAKDELTLSYRLGTPDDVERARPSTSSLKAKSDGEDLLTPLVEKAAADIAAKAARGGR